MVEGGMGGMAERGLRINRDWLEEEDGCFCPQIHVQVVPLLQFCETENIYFSFCALAA